MQKTNNCLDIFFEHIQVSKFESKRIETFVQENDYLPLSENIPTNTVAKPSAICPISTKSPAYMWLNCSTL